MLSHVKISPFDGVESQAPGVFSDLDDLFLMKAIVSDDADAVTTVVREKHELCDGVHSYTLQ